MSLGSLLKWGIWALLGRWECRGQREDTASWPWGRGSKQLWARSLGPSGVGAGWLEG